MTKLYAIILVCAGLVVVLMLLARVARSQIARRHARGYRPWMGAVVSGLNSPHQSDGGAGHGGSGGGHSDGGGGGVGGAHH
jgi:uncharacterized membrane protein YgcG